jgi:hypothetical protein
MTPDQRTLAIWGGIGATAIVAGWFAMDAIDAAGPAQRAEALHAEYQQLYRPADPPSGLDAAQAVARAKQAADAQQQELAAAIQQLAPPLPRDYVDAAGEDLKAQSLLQSVTDDLGKRCEQAKVTVPTWPITQLDRDPGVRSRQLATVYCYAQMVRLMLDAGVRGLGTPVVGEAKSDPGGSVARFPVALSCTATWESTDRLLHALRDAHGAGLGLTDVTVDMQADGTRKVAISASLLLPNRPEWKLAKLDVVPRPAPGAAPAAGQTPPSSVLPPGPQSAPQGGAVRPPTTSGADRL